MKPPGGSRQGTAGDEPRGESGPRDQAAAGPAAHDRGDRGDEPGGDDDAGLRAMRAVWLTMRDEDPSDRGLADLLAAARGKAEAMQPRPSAWLRLLAAMRRPPALALATAMVLLAGAALIGRRVADEAPASAPAIARPSTPISASGRADTAGAGAATGSHRTQDALDRGVGSGSGAEAAPGGGTPAPAEAAARDGEQTAREAAAPAASAPPAESPAARAMATPPSDPTRPGATAPTRSVKAAAAPRAGRAGDDLGATGREPGPEPDASPDGRSAGFASPPRSATPPAPRDERAGAADGSGPGAAGTLGAPRPPSTGAASHARGREPSPGAPGASPPPPPAAPAPDAPGPEPRPAASSDATAPDGRTARATAAPGELYRQCETAARRGDCAAVRRLVSQIARTDRGYRARVARDSAVGKCLAE